MNVNAYSLYVRRRIDGHSNSIIVSKAMRCFVVRDYRRLRNFGVPADTARQVIWSCLLTGHTCTLAHSGQITP